MRNTFQTILILLLVCHQIWAQKTYKFEPKAYWSMEGKNFFQSTNPSHVFRPNNRYPIQKTPNGSNQYLRFIDHKSYPLSIIEMGNTSKIAIEFAFRMSVDDHPHGILFRSTDQSLLFYLTEKEMAFNTRSKNRKGEINYDESKVNLDGTGIKNYGYYIDSKWHHVVAQYDAIKGKKEVWIDGRLEGFFTKKVEAKGTVCGEDDCKKEIQFGKFFQGDMDNIAVYEDLIPPALIRKHAKQVRDGKPFSFTYDPNVLSREPTIPVHDLGVDKKEFPPSHPKVKMSAVEQLRNYPLPRFKGGNGLRRNFNWMGMDYFGGVKTPGTSRQMAIEASVQIQEELALNWNYMLGLQNIKAARKIRHGNLSGTFTGAWIKLANQYPSIPLSATTFWAQAPVSVLGEGQTRAYIRRNDLSRDYYLQNNKGQFLNTFGEVGKSGRYVSPASSGELFRKDGQAIRLSFEAAFEHLNRPINFINENGEVEPKLYNPEVLSKDPRVVRHKAKSKIEDWGKYQALQKLRFKQIYSLEFLANKELEGATFSWYGVDAGPISRYDWEVSREIGTQVNGQYYSTPDFYPRWPNNWKKWNGPWRGWEWIKLSREKEILAGDRLFSPFVAAGWNPNPESNLRPSQWLGLLKVLGVVGAEFFYTGFFTESSGKGDDVFADPKNYAWQAVIPSYAQAITSWYEDILREGDLLLDEKGTPMVEYPLQDPRMLLAIRKHRNKKEYILAGTVQPISNMKGNVPDVLSATCELEGKQYEINLRRQGSVYRLSLEDKMPKIIQLDSWHEASHPLRWKKRLILEAELFDAAEKAKVNTSWHSDARSGNLTDFTTYAQGIAKGYIGFDLGTMTRTKRVASIKIKCKKVNKSQDPKVRICMNGKAISPWMPIENLDWKWIELKIGNKDQRAMEKRKGKDNTLKVEFSEEGAQIDALEIFTQRS